jgi:2-C-methyl-D-erythritol 4-phosphate cytidylyltransferase
VDGAIPVIPIVDTLKRVKDREVVETVPREGLVRVQTPQAFRATALARAHREADLGGEDATDDAMLLERLGLRVAVVPGEPENIKITTSHDLRLASLLGRPGG